MRIAAITDIHGNIDALEAVLADIAARGADVTVNLGDILSGPLWPVETADRLIPLCLPTIMGNHERQLISQPRDKMGQSDAYAASLLTEAHFSWLVNLPGTLWLSQDVFLCHGTPSDDLEYFLEDATEGGCCAAARELVERRAGEITARLILCGHTHMPRAIRLSPDRLIVNPGSVGLPGFAGNHPYPHVIATGTPDARYAMIDNGSGNWEAELIAIPYKWDRAARQAAGRGQFEWSKALATGYP